VSGYEAYEIFAHLCDTGTIEAAGEILGRGIARGMTEEIAKADKLQLAAPRLAVALENLLKIAGVELEGRADAQIAAARSAIVHAGRLP